MFKQLASLFLAAISVTSGLGPAVTVRASADTVAEPPAIESSYVLDDLQGATIEGEAFDISDYPEDTLLGQTRLISFAEYGYDSQEREDYSLFAYIYNPKKIEFDVEGTKTVLNQITFSVGNGEFTKYPLSYVNSSIGESEGLFYKFRVMLTDSEKATIYESFSGMRVYNVGEFELIKAGAYVNADAYNVGKQYIYSGTENGENISCRVSALETISLEVGHTQYRPKGENSRWREGEQDSLHSVWFAVPKEVTDEDGKMTAVHARWRDAVLKPQIVTSNKDAYDNTSALLGKDVGRFVGYDSYGYYTKMKRVGMQPDGSYKDTKAEWSYNLSANAAANPTKEIFAIYYTGNSEIDSADSYVLSSEQILEEMNKSAELYGGDLVNGKYSEKIFSSVADEWTDVVVRSEDTFSLESWEPQNCTFWGMNFNVIQQTFHTAEAIKLLSDTDFEGYIGEENVSDETVEAICDKLFVSTADFNKLYLDYTLLKKTHDIYLFRYQVSTYLVQELHECWNGINNAWFNTWRYWEVDTNAYMFSETVNLDFDIIDVEITNDLGSTIIPVVMSPKDIVPDATPPVNTESDEPIPAWVWILILVVLVLLALIIMCFIPQTAPVAQFILKALWAIVSAPVRLVVLLIKKAQQRKKQDEASVLETPEDTSQTRLKPMSRGGRTSPKEGRAATKRKSTTTKKK